MFDQIVAALNENPYLGVALVFLLCGLGFPLPEEIVLLAAGYVCAKFPEHATLHWMMVWCAGAILTGDLIPFVLGRVFGVRLLRLRWLRYYVTKQRLANFDRWFRKRGDLVIFIARFLAGLRVVAFFTAGSMKMPWRRFLFYDGLGILLIVPLLTWAGFHSASFIESMILTVQRVERGILWGAIGGLLVVGLWWWLWKRRRRLARQQAPRDTFVEPKQPIADQGVAARPATDPVASPAEAPADSQSDSDEEPPAPPAAPDESAPSAG